MDTNTPITPSNYLSHPALEHRRSLPRGLQHRSPKMKSICEDLLSHPGSTRLEIMGRVNPELSGDSNRCYFRRMHDGGPRGFHDEARYSVIVNGLVRITGRTSTGRLTYSLTPAGRRCARA
jgi:hypothetical protein